MKSTKFKNIFEGLKIAYGQYQSGERNDNGKQQTKAFIVRKNVSDELYGKTSTGKRSGFGHHPNYEDNTCRWGCIDIDVYNLDHTSLIQSIRNLSLPLIVCRRSKSGGAHIFIYKIYFCIFDAIKIKTNGHHTWV